MRAARASYASFLRQPDVVRMLLMALVARMPIGTVSLAMLLHVRALTGSFATAGATVGIYLAAAAITAPLVGRYIDRNGPRGALLVTGIVSPGALLTMWAAKPTGLDGSSSLWAVAAVAGAFSPPITVLTRTMWRYRFADEAARKMAFALDGVLIEFAFTAGPALIALLLAIGSPTVAFGAAFVFMALAVPIFVASPALRYWRHDPHADRHLLGPLTEPRLIAVYATTFLLTVAFGLLEVAYPGFAAQAQDPPLAGVLLAVNSMGSAIGGLVYGALHVKAPRERQLRIGIALLVLPLALQGLIGHAGLLAIVAFVAGLCIAPTFTIVTLLVSAYAPARYATEAFTWSATCVVSGIGAGNAVGGVLLERYGSALVFGASGAAALMSATFALALVRRPRYALHETG